MKVRTSVLTGAAEQKPKHALFQTSSEAKVMILLTVKKECCFLCKDTAFINELEGLFVPNQKHNLYYIVVNMHIFVTYKRLTCLKGYFYTSSIRYPFVCVVLMQQ